ncbi:MAG: hypothetical protein B6244_13360 [Candidatus Cloacimonetes bacterium 4572_55]|nr:MAG: hypothetical protein B6244_13360 [Candidatus Cloacimonetes bacterium 4572_55]
MGKAIENAYYRQLERRLFDMSALFDVSQALNSSLDLHAILDAILLTILGKHACNRGIILLRESDDLFTVNSLRGALHGIKIGFEIQIDLPAEEMFFFSDEIDFFRKNQLHLSILIRKNDRTIGLICLGKKVNGRSFDPSELEFLISLSNIASTSIENAQVYRQMKVLNRRLDWKLQELNSLFEVGEELNFGFDPDRILQVLALTLMGQMAISKCFVCSPCTKDDTKIDVTIKRGLGSKKINSEQLTKQGFRSLFSNLNDPIFVQRITKEEIRETCLNAGIFHLIPMQIKNVTKGILGVGAKFGDKTITPFPEDNLEYLKMLAAQTMIALENAQLFQLAVEKERIEKELEVAKNIQRSLLPSNNPKYPGFQISGFNISCFQVGGDYYDFIHLTDRCLGLAIGDVTGKGVPAALLMANMHAYLRSHVEYQTPVNEMISKINSSLHISTGTTGKFITFVYADLDVEKRELTYCNAGHNYPILFRNSGEKEYLDAGGLPLGMFPGAPYQAKTIQLHPGDLLTMYTDGVSEAWNRDENEYGEERLEALIKAHRKETADDLMKRILQDVANFSDGMRQTDDITIVLCKAL